MAAFVMNGIVIEVVIERGGEAFGLGVHDAMVSAVSSLTFKIAQGGYTEFSVELNPTFEAATEIINSGMLGYGFVGGSAPPLTKKEVRGVFRPTKTSEQALGGMQEANAAVFMRVRFGYSDDSTLGMSPWFYGSMMAPSISFGEEISITLNALSGSYWWMLDDAPRAIEEASLSEVIAAVCSRNGITPVYIGSAEAKANDFKVTKMQTTNSFIFLFDQFTNANLTGYFVGGTEDKPGEQFIVVSKQDMYSKRPNYKFVMYKQINVNRGIYPILGIDADISPANVMGFASGSEVVTVDSANKEVKTNRIDEKKMDEPSTSTTVGMKVPQGKGSPGGGIEGGIIAGPDSVSSRIVTNYREEDNQSIQTAEQTSIDQDKKAFQMTIETPLLPFIMPAQLVTIEVGNIFPISGNFEVFSVEHTIGEGGGTTSMEVLRSMGAFPSEESGVQVNELKPAESAGAGKGSANPSVMSVASGVMKKVGL